MTETKMRLANDTEEYQSPAPEEQDTAEELTEEKAREMRRILQEFLSSYAQKPENVATEDWLAAELKRQMPDITEDEAKEIAQNTVKTVELYDRKLDEVNRYCAAGHTKEEWLSDTLQKAAVGVEVNQFGSYLSGIDQAITEANEAMCKAVMTQQNTISMNPNLDGFIAEQYAVNTHNLDAALKNSDYRAVRLDRPEGGAFGKNSVDIKIINKDTGETVQRYQAKFYKDAKSSIKALDPSRYGNQRGLVAKGQAKADVVRDNLPKGSKKTINDYIGGTDGVDSKSKPLSKNAAERMRDRAQKSGRVNGKVSWNSYDIKDLTINIGKQAAFAGVGAAALGAGASMAAKAIQGEKIEGEQVIETALVTGADAGVKAATAGALMVGAERNVLTFIPKREMRALGQEASRLGIVGSKLAAAFPYTVMACVAIENIKIMSKCARGELTATETLDYMGRGTVSIIGGMIAGGWGAGALVAALSLTTGPFAIAAGLVGGIVAGIAGSKIGEVVYEGAKTVVKAGVSVVKTVVKKGYEVLKTAGSVGRSVIGGAVSVGRSVGGLIKGIFS